MAMWELAPGSPWNAIFSFLVIGVSCGFVAGLVRIRGRLNGLRTSETGRQYPSGHFEVRRGIDPARDGIDDGDVDPHPGFKGAELFQLFLLFQRRGRQRDEALQRCAAVGVDADMMVARTIAMGGRGAG